MLNLDPGIIEGIIQTPESTDRVLHQLLDICFLRNVATHKNSCAPSRQNLLDCGLPARHMHVRHHDSQPLRGKGQGRGAPDACPGSGYDRHAPRKRHAHCFYPRQ